MTKDEKAFAFIIHLIIVKLFKVSQGVTGKNYLPTLAGLGLLISWGGSRLYQCPSPTSVKATGFTRPILQLSYFYPVVNYSLLTDSGPGEREEKNRRCKKIKRRFNWGN